MLVFTLVCMTLCPFKFCNQLEQEERADYFAFIVLRISCYCKCPVALPRGVGVGLQVVIVVFRLLTYLFTIPLPKFRL